MQGGHDLQEQVARTSIPGKAKIADFSVIRKTNSLDLTDLLPFDKIMDLHMLLGEERQDSRYEKTRSAPLMQP